MALATTDRVQAANLVGVGKIVSRDRTADAHVTQPGLHPTKTDLAIAKALAVRELGRGHDLEVISAGERLGLEAASISSDTGVESAQRNQVHDLRAHDPVTETGCSISRCRS